MTSRAYECPQCHSPIEVGKAPLSEIRCTGCGNVYACTNDVIDFSASDPCFLSGDKEYDTDMMRILDDARARGWYEALRSYDQRRGSTTSKTDYATSLSRVDFRVLLPLTKNSRVLDIGGGHGLISLSLARSVAAVFTIEKIRAQAEFIALRARQSGIANVSVASGGSGCRFPYRPNSFDLIVVNGVFEWLGFETTYEKVAETQGRFLQELGRMLKPDGMVWLTTKNKYSLPITLSRSANNNNCRLVSLLPDAAINWISKLRGRGEYLSALKSVPGYRKLFASHGLVSEAIWVPMPSVRYPTELVPYSKGERFVSPTNYRHCGRLSRAIYGLTSWPVAKRIMLNHVFLLRKEGSTAETIPSLVQSALAATPETDGGRVCSVFCPESSSASSAVIATVKRAANLFVVKLTRYEDSNFLELERENIQTARGLCRSFADYIPEVVSTGRANGCQYSIMKRYAGVSLHSNRFSRRLGWLLARRSLQQTVGSFVLELARSSRKQNNRSFEDCVKMPFQDLLKEKHDQGLRDFTTECQRRLAQAWDQIPLVFQHGDLSLGNLVIQRVLPLEFKILDWESASEDGFPCVDLYRFVHSCRLTNERIATLVRRYCDDLAIDARIASPLVYVDLVQSRSQWARRNKLTETVEWEAREKTFERRAGELADLSAILDDAVRSGPE